MNPTPFACSRLGCRAAESGRERKDREEEEYSRRKRADSPALPLERARKPDRREPKLSAKLGQPGKKRWEKERKRRNSSEKPTCLHVRRVAAAGATRGARGVRRDRSIMVD